MPMEKLNVAIADDNEILLDLLEEIIKSDDELNVVGKARNGEEAYGIIKEKEPDVVLLDIVMPKMDGLCVMNKVKRDATIKKQPAFIMISAIGQESITEDAFEMGANYYIMKPFDNEVIMAVNPDVILISPFKRGGYDALKEVGIPLIPHLGYKEMTPLGQAEWMKFIGLLTGTEEKANHRFAEIEKKYNELKTRASGVKERPVVFSGELRGGNWYAVGGKSFLAQLFKDAGADYFLKDNEESGGVTLDFETVYQQASEAKYWRIVNSYPGAFTYDVLKEDDERYADFRAFKEKGVVYCNMREKPFYESMPVEPELILADLIKAFHPQLLPEDYQPAYYELLK